jgi:hypothetical protein
MKNEKTRRIYRFYNAQNETVYCYMLLEPIDNLVKLLDEKKRELSIERDETIYFEDAEDF